MTAMMIPHPMATITAHAIRMDTAMVARGHASAMNGILVTARGGL